MKAIKIEIDRTILAGIKIGLAIIIITLLAACQSTNSGIPYIPKKSIETKTSNPVELYEPITETTATSSNPKTKEIKLVSLLDAFKAALGALSKIVKYSDPGEPLRSPVVLCVYFKTCF